MMSKLALLSAVAGVSMGITGCAKPPRPAPAPVPEPYTEQERVDRVGHADDRGPIVRYEEPPVVRRPPPPPPPSRYEEPLPPPPPEPVRRYEEPPAIRRPVPPPQAGPGPVPPPPPPIVQEELPEHGPFVAAYNKLGQPKLAVIVYRSNDPADPFRAGNEAPPPRSDGGGPLNDRAVDYRVLELSLQDWLAAQGRVSIRSSSQLPTEPKPAEIAAIRNGDRNVAQQVGERLGVDVLVVVWAEVSRHTEGGLTIRLASEAIFLSDRAPRQNVRGDSIGRASVDMPPRMQLDTIHVTTRAIARKLLLDMTQTWNAWTR
jgi:hypothetical protein